MLLCYRLCFIVGYVVTYTLHFCVVFDVMLLRYRLCYIAEILRLTLLCCEIYYVAILMTVLKVMVRVFVVSNGVLYFATIQYYIFRFTMLCDVAFFYATLFFVVSYFTLEYRGLLGGNISSDFVIIPFTLFNSYTIANISIVTKIYYVLFQAKIYYSKNVKDEHPHT